MEGFKQSCLGPRRAIYWTIDSPFRSRQWGAGILRTATRGIGPFCTNHERWGRGGCSHSEFTSQAPEELFIFHGLPSFLQQPFGAAVQISAMSELRLKSCYVAKGHFGCKRAGLATRRHLTALHCPFGQPWKCVTVLLETFWILAVFVHFFGKNLLESA